MREYMTGVRPNRADRELQPEYTSAEIGNETGNTGRDVIRNEKQEKELLRVCRFLYSRGYVRGSGGNVSVRTEKGAVITPSGLSLRELKPDDLVYLFRDGTFFCESKNKPSKEWRMHLRCYERTEVNAVIHVHSVYATAVSCQPDLDESFSMPVYTPGYALRVGKLRAVPYEKPGSPELSCLVGRVIDKDNSVLLKNHGSLAVGGRLSEALNVIEEIEENAHITLLLQERPGNALNQEQRERLKK